MQHHKDNLAARVEFLLQDPVKFEQVKHIARFPMNQREESDRHLICCLYRVCKKRSAEYITGLKKCVGCDAVFSEAPIFCPCCGRKLRRRRRDKTGSCLVINHREDGRLEWVCQHGVGHTIAVPVKYAKDPTWWSHGCCGCCTWT